MASSESMASSSDMSAGISESTADSFVMADPLAATTTLPQEQHPLGEKSDIDDEDNESELDSLPSISTSVLSPSDAGSSLSDAQREWEASLEQLQLMLTMVLVPFAGKYLGRKFAYWSWSRYMEWVHDVDIRWTSKKTFAATGVIEAAATL